MSLAAVCALLASQNSAETDWVAQSSAIIGTQAQLVTSRYAARLCWNQLSGEPLAKDRKGTIRGKDE